MPRRGRSASPPPAPRRSSPMRAAPPPPAPARAAAAPAHPPAPAPVSHTPAPAPQPSGLMSAPSQGPGLMGQIAATAGGVALGNVVAGGINRAIYGGGSDHATEAAPAATAAPSAPAPQYGSQSSSLEPSGPCAWEIKQFLHCAETQSDLTLCDGFNEALRQCKISKGLSL